MNRKNALTLASFLAMFLLLTPTITNAQDSDTDADASNENSAPQKQEEVLVTGSIIRRTEDSSHLVTKIDLEEIVLQGLTTPVEILSTITQNSGSSRTSTTTATGGGLANFANLRALGSENTLTLVNGKRMVKSPLAHNAVDFNTVPMALLQSIDVLSDGASSIYGTDAVAGVINFRMKKEVQGIQYYAFALEPTDDGGESSAAAISGGFGSLASEGWNISLGGTWRERKLLRTADREFSRLAFIPERGINGLLSQSFPSNVSQIGPDGVIVNNANPYPDCDPPITRPFRGACGIDADAAGFIALQNPEEQKSFIGRFTRLIGENAEFTAEYLWADSTISSGIAPTTFSNLPITPDSPYFPGAGLIPAIPGLDPTLPAGVTSRWAPGGRRTTQNDSNTDRILLQVSGDSGAYDYEVYGLQSSGEASLSMLDGAYHIPEFDGGFAGTSGVFLNPFGDQSDEANAFLDSIRVTGELVNAQSTLKMVGATLGRDLWNLDAGPVIAAIAIEYGEEDVDYYRDPIANELRGGVVGGDQTVDGKRDQYSITGEVLIPVTDSFEINASVRYDDYSDFGDTTNPKILLSYDASDRVNIHGSYNTGFRAPTLFNIVTPSTLSFIVGNPYDDPVLCPGGVVNESAGGIDIRDCGVRYNSQIGGNKNLTPEESEAYAFGVDVQATDTFQFSIDYWDYDLDNKIGPLSHPAIFANPERFASLLVRCSQADPVLAAGSNTCNFGGGGDPIAYVIQTNTNLGKTMTSGFDLTANWFADTNMGLIGIDYRATYVRDYDFERVPGDPTFSRAGQYFDGFPVPEYVHYLAFNWQNGKWSGQLQNQFVKGYTDCNGQCGIATEYFNEVGDYSPFNLTASYAFSEALSISLHIKNLFDEDPPFTNGGPLCATCDPRFTDPTGRAVGVTVRGTFDY